MKSTPEKIEEAEQEYEQCVSFGQTQSAEAWLRISERLRVILAEETSTRAVGASAAEGKGPGE